MYEIILAVHSLLRWLVLFCGVAAVVVGFRGWLGGKPWKPAHRKVSAAFIGSVHLSVVLGLLLYLGLSPVAEAARADMAVSMKDAVLRFWAVEHFTMMVLAAIVAHGAHVVAKNKDDEKSRFKIMALGFSLSLIMIFAAIPWPFRDAIGRGLLPTL